MPDRPTSTGRPRVPPAELPETLLLATGGAALGLASARWELILPVLFALGLQPLLAGRIRIRLGLMNTLLLAMPFAVLYRVYEVEGSRGLEFNTPFYLALFLLAYATLDLYGTPGPRRTALLLLAGSAGVAAAGLDLTEEVFLPLLAVHGLDAVVVMRTRLRSRPNRLAGAGGRNAAATVSVLAVALLAGGTILSIRASGPELNRFFLRLIRRATLDATVGFSESARLGSVVARQRGDGGERVAVRAYGPVAPGYLRGKAFFQYGSGVWTTLATGREYSVGREEEDRRIGKIARFVIPGRPVPSETAEPALTIYPASTYQAHYFLPLETAAVDTASRSLFLHPGNILTSKYRGTDRGYGLLLSPAPVRDIDWSYTRRTDVPLRESPAPNTRTLPRHPAMLRTLDRTIRRIERDGLLSAERPAEAVAAITHYFAREYEYRLGIDLPPRQEPVHVFLTARRHGHCELFASAGALLLRRIGIPSRYVTGFVCMEPSPYGDLWLARRKHAHAWVEYWDPVRGWRTAEFTPPAGRPQPSKPSGVDALLEYLHALGARLAGIVRRYGAGGLLELLLAGVAQIGSWLIGSWWRAALVTGLLALFFLRRWTAGRRRAGRGRRRRAFPATIAELRRRFFALERRLARRGLRRRPDETPGEFATRVERSGVEDAATATAFLRHFERRRYEAFGEEEDKTTEETVADA